MGSGHSTEGENSSMKPKLPAFGGRRKAAKPAKQPDAASVGVGPFTQAFGKRLAVRKNAEAESTGTTRNTADLLEQGRGTQAVPQIEPRVSQMQLLLLDEDAAVLRVISEIATEMGFEVHAFKNASLAEALLDRQSIDVVLMDLRSIRSGMHTLESLRHRMPRVPIVVMTAFATVHSAVDAMRRGASDYLTKPFGLEELTTTLRKVAQQREFDHESRRLREQLQKHPELLGVFGTSAAIQKLLRMAAKVAFASHPVLIVGENGTGKEMLASVIAKGSRLLQQSSETAKHGEKGTLAIVPAEPASEASFVTVDCGALSPALLETELFGYVREEGTAEREERHGVLTDPEGGAVFLDSVSEMPLDLQAKLLRAMQDRRVRPAGASSSRAVTVRILAASSRDLATLVGSGLFRKDLYFRLNVVNFRIPPLRERPEDVPVMAEYFLQKHSHERHMNMSFSADAAQALSFYPWPGNVRELESVIERACALSTGPVIHLVDLPTGLQNTAAEMQAAVRVDTRKLQDPQAGAVGADRDGIVSLADLEKQAILNALKKLNGDKLKAAKMLGIGKTTLYRKLKEYGIEEG